MWPSCLHLFKECGHNGEALDCCISLRYVWFTYSKSSNKICKLKLLFLCLFSPEWLAFSVCLPYQYFFVNRPLTWTDAQTYCRQAHTDLVTIENAADVDQLVKILSFVGLSSEVWVGLFSEIHWKWSDGFTENQTEFRDWETYSNEPDFALADQFCVLFDSNGRWWDEFCASKNPFICYNGKKPNLKH